MEHLRDGIGLRGYGQKDPKQEYKKEGFNIFVQMIARVSSTVMTKLMHAEVRRPVAEENAALAELRRLTERVRQAEATHDEPLPMGAEDEPEPEPLISAEMDCPCGSGKPFSKCHGVEDGESSSEDSEEPASASA
jgi:preprotein translocase subunit SecA